MANENVKQSVRIQTSLLNGIEKKFLVWMAGKLPKWVTSDMLTAFGVLGSFVGAVGYVLAGLTGNLNWIWLSSFGLVMNWYGDSLDGSVARVRNQQRKLYGYYLDHNIDCVCEFFLFVGFGLSGLCNLWIALLCYVFYLQLEVYVAINAHIKNEFKLTYGKLGPTEFRLIVIICNTFLMYVPIFRPENYSFDLVSQGGLHWIPNLGLPTTLYMMDWVGFGIAGILMTAYLVSFFKDLHYFAKIDPLVKQPKESEKKD